MSMLMVLALTAAAFHSSEAVGAGTAQAGASKPSCDITDVNCILTDLKASTVLPDPSTFQSDYQQFAEMIAPVMLLAHGGNFEVSTVP